MVVPHALAQSLNVPPVPKPLAPLPLAPSPLLPKPGPVPLAVPPDVVSPPVQFQDRPEQTQVTSS